MKLSKNFLIAIVLVLSFVGGYAQQDAQYSMYMFNGLAINPAYAGSRGAVSATLLLREQWVGINGRPRTQSFNIHGTNLTDRHGWGFSMVNDRLGITNHLNLMGVYAYRLRLGAGNLALGLQGGVQNYNNRWSEVRTVDPDLLLPSQNTNAWLPQIGTGAYYNTERFFCWTGRSQYSPE